MSEQASRLIAEALKLTTQERAEVAAELMASIDGEPDADAEVAWARVTDLRVHRIKAEGPRGDDWESVHDRIAARLRSR